jgi:hypothetical protein
MEYRGIRYTIRAGIERGQWVVVIQPEGFDVTPNKIFGAREDAESEARHMINRWLEGNENFDEPDSAGLVYIGKLKHYLVHDVLLGFVRHFPAPLYFTQ